MRKFVQIYASHGVLGHEKQPVYTVGKPAGENCNRLTVALPAEYRHWENTAGEIGLTIDGKDYLLRDILTNWGDMPCIRWVNQRNVYRRVILSTVQEEE